MMWNSLLRVQELIDKVAQWRVGNGESIKIWAHRWLPTLPPSKFNRQLLISLKKLQFKN